jgi:DNA-binding NarL/FixJ family response regulator/c-di-GMP-binding flagellar brake protein YcgR
MKTIVIIENETVELEILVRLFQQMQKEINIVTASEEQAAISIMSRQQVDLVVCDLAIPGNTDLESFANLTRSFPSVPCIALADDSQSHQKEKIIERGASHCLEKPVNKDDLLHRARELLNIGTSGRVKGIPIHSFLQMLANEEKTCTLQVTHKKDRGMLYIKQGRLVGAETKSFTGEEAAHLILTWEETVLEIKYYNCQHRPQIDKPLISIIMEAFRLKSEREKLQRKKFPEKKHQLPLVHLSTHEHPISLRTGAEIKMEFPHMETIQESSMIGSFGDQYLIVTTPPSFSMMEKMVSTEKRIIVKYIEDGRIWMFKSRLLKSLNSPSPLLFLEYPATIHYHELRKTKRTVIFVPCTVHRGSQPELYGVLTDLNISGALCRIKNDRDQEFPEFNIHDRIQLRCLLPETTEEQKITGIIRNLKKEKDAARIGIEFEDLQPHLHETISNYVYAVENNSNLNP